MKNSCLVLCIPLMLLMALLPVRSVGQVPMTGFAVVELFTSEGCSSCPPADDVLVKLNLEYAGKTLYLLSFHVDYWDNLGWKDPFSNSAFTQRQQRYGQLFGASIYTPQAIVNGQKELIGSQSGTLHNLINANIRRVPDNSIACSASFKNRELNVNYQLENFSDKELINVALVQERAVSRVAAGENKGTTISHVNVVRVFKTVKGERSGSVQLTIPDDMRGSNLRIILYVQDKNTWQIKCANTLLIKPVMKTYIIKS
ncbi:DUF1223 domain-containing protein [Mucilaginibacter sp. RS28]|uniref:DUF1223 domain-containing protein n=1 Tax=Mucilaginibacter straminoryzae TaxID=2932774 RepID=A0A9X1X1L3_9SPHI|nr:DUF1223 domain-containing protein [Mucilaginibacter straminoryzae]MCJ8208941.1 DUF1223 domain-containing protein [Mucilaginibacter straminoryzae]